MRTLQFFGVAGLSRRQRRLVLTVVLRHWQTLARGLGFARPAATDERLGKDDDVADQDEICGCASALFLLLIPVACGSDDDDGSPARGTTTEQTGTAETETGEDTTEEP